MKKCIYFIFALFMAIVMNSCDCGCENVEPLELKDPEVEAYKLYSPGGHDYNKLYVYKYETSDAYIYRYIIAGETKNIEVIPKNKTVQKNQDTESVLSKDTYFDY